MARPALVAAVLFWLAAPCAGGHFVASLQANYVVNLDFSSDTSASAGLDGTDAKSCTPGASAESCSAAAGPSAVAPAEETRVLGFAGGKRKFRCKLPGRRGTRSSLTKEEREKAELHFRNAKLLPYKGRCWTWRKEEDFWNYEICFGRKMSQYNKGATLTNSLGEHEPQRDALVPGGGVLQHYGGGTEGRSSEVRFVCGTASKSARRLTVEEPAQLQYVFEVGGPQFCAWRGDGTSATDAQGAPLVLSSLLEDLRGDCINTTQGWWTYEYCFPHTLRQYHLQGDVRDPVHTLGTLNGSTETMKVDQVNMSMLRLKPPLAGGTERTGTGSPPAFVRVLEQRLGGGAVCDETGKARSAAIHFQCTPTWESKADTRFISIHEGQLCEYQVVIHTPQLCGHRMLVPALPRGNDVIRCQAEPEDQ